jgi:hypothetical protein
MMKLNISEGIPDRIKGSNRKVVSLCTGFMIKAGLLVAQK